MIDVVRVANTITGAQLKLSHVTGVALGQEHQKHAKAAYEKPAALIALPYSPRENLASGRSSGWNTRSRRMHAMDIMLANIWHTRLREMIAPL